MNPEGRWKLAPRAPDTGDAASPESTDDAEKIPYSAARAAAEQYGEPGAAIAQFSRPEFFNQKIEALPNVPDNIKRLLCAPQTHPAAHAEGYMMRSLRRQGPEFDFALAAAEYLSPLLVVDSENFRHIQKQAQQAIGVIGMRGPDSTMWWTFAPYLYQNMLAKGLAKEAALQRLVEWAKTSPKPNERIGLAGLEMFDDEGIRDYGLPKDVNNNLHKFTAQEAGRIVRDVFGIKEAETR